MSEITEQRPDTSRDWVTLLGTVMFLAGLLGIVLKDLPDLERSVRFTLTMLGHGLAWSGAATYFFGTSRLQVVKLSQSYHCWWDIPTLDRSAPLVITLVTPLATVLGVFAVWAHLGLPGDNYVTSWYGLVMGIIWIVAGLYPPITINLLIRTKFEPWRTPS